MGREQTTQKLMRLHDNPAVLHYVIFAVVFVLEKGEERV